MRNRKEPSEADTILRRLEGKLETVDQRLGISQAEAEAFKGELGQLGRDVKKHGMAIENLLDGLEQQMGDGQERREREKV